MTLLCKALVPKLPSTHPSGHWCWLCSTAVPSTRTAHFQVIPASLPGQLHSSGTSHSQLLPAHCKQHSSIVSPSGFLIRKQESSALSEMPDHPLSSKSGSIKHKKSSVLQQTHNSPPPFPLLFGSWPPTEASERGINVFCQPILFSSHQNQINASFIVLAFSFAVFFLYFTS